MSLSLEAVVNDLRRIMEHVNNVPPGEEREEHPTFEAVQRSLHSELQLHLLSYVRFLEAQGFLVYDRNSHELELTGDGEAAWQQPHRWRAEAEAAFADQVDRIRASSEHGAVGASGAQGNGAHLHNDMADTNDGIEVPLERLAGQASWGEELVDDVFEGGENMGSSMEDPYHHGAQDMAQQEEVPMMKTAATQPDTDPELKAPSESLLGVSSDGLYERLSEIGSGGIGTVYRARQVRLAREVALKEVREIFHVFAGVQRGDIINRFQEIVQAQATLSHPNIIQVYDIDVDAEYPFVVMEYAPRGNLRRLIEVEGRPPLTVALKYFLQILHALNAAHDNDIVHGGIKPENVVIDQSGNAKLTDFGISRVVERDGSNQVYVGVGTVAYMSPEQFRDPNEASKGSDIYSLGIMFYEMLTGKVPGRRSPMPSSFFPDIPRKLDDIFDRMSMDAREDRFASIDDILVDFYSSEDVMSILDKRSGVLFLRDPLQVGDHGLGGDVDLPELADDDFASPAAGLGGGGYGDDLGAGASYYSEAIDDDGEGAAAAEAGGDEADLDDIEIDEDADVMSKLSEYSKMFDGGEDEEESGEGGAEEE